MTVMRVERVVYGVSDLEECVRFFDDFGLKRIAGRAGRSRARCAAPIPPAASTVPVSD